MRRKCHDSTAVDAGIGRSQALWRAGPVAPCNSLGQVLPLSIRDAPMARRWPVLVVRRSGAGESGGEAADRLRFMVSPQRAPGRPAQFRA